MNMVLFVAFTPVFVLKMFNLYALVMFLIQKEVFFILNFVFLPLHCFLFYFQIAELLIHLGHLSLDALLVFHCFIHIFPDCFKVFVHLVDLMLELAELAGERKDHADQDHYDESRGLLNLFDQSVFRVCLTVLLRVFLFFK